MNQWIRTKAPFDSIIDFDQVVRDPANPDLMRPPFNCGDGIHPSPVGYYVMGKSVDLGSVPRFRPAPLAPQGSNVLSERAAVARACLIAPLAAPVACAVTLVGASVALGLFGRASLPSPDAMFDLVVGVFAVGHSARLRRRPPRWHARRPDPPPLWPALAMGAVGCWRLPRVRCVFRPRPLPARGAILDPVSVVGGKSPWHHQRRGLLALAATHLMNCDSKRRLITRSLRDGTLKSSHKCRSRSVTAAAESQPWYRPPASVARTPESRASLAFILRSRVDDPLASATVDTAYTGTADSHATDHAAGSRRGTIAARASGIAEVSVLTRRLASGAGRRDTSPFTRYVLRLRQASAGGDGGCATPETSRTPPPVPHRKWYS